MRKQFTICHIEVNMITNMIDLSTDLKFSHFCISQHWDDTGTFLMNENNLFIIYIIVNTTNV